MNDTRGHRAGRVIELDATLIAAAGGDTSAREVIYRQLLPAVHGVVLARVGPQDAEDVTQEAFMRILSQLGTLRDAAALAPWACRMARNIAVDHVRGRQRRRTESLGEIATTGRAHGDGEAFAHAVLDQIRQLPAAYRETLVLRLVEGLTGPEIAERTGLTSGSVRVNLCRGMSMLRLALAREGLA